MPIKQRPIESVRGPKPSKQSGYRPDAQTFALPSSTKSKTTFVFTPHPWVVEGGRVVVDAWSADRFWALLCREFEPPIPKYQVCEHLDIHRCILEEWIRGVNGAKASNFIKSTRDGLVFPKTDEAVGLANLKPARLYDPWTDREHDYLMQSYFSAFPWFVIDKYYLIQTDEVLFHTGERRIRPDGNTFTPITDEDAFRPFINGQGWSRADWPKDAYADICEAASRPAETRKGLRRRPSEIAADKLRTKVKAEADHREAWIEQRINTLGIGTHPWLGQFLRNSPHIPDEWFEHAIKDETHRLDAERRWAEIAKRDHRLARIGVAASASQAVKPKPGVRPQNTRVSGQPDIAKVGSLRNRGRK